MADMYVISPPLNPGPASLRIPGSKSYTNRALLLGAQVSHPVRIQNPLFSDDTEAMINCLETLGIGVDRDGSSLIVRGDIRNVTEETYELNANLSGTTIRFMLALACVVPGTKILHGNGHLNERPVAGLVDALRGWGADIDYLGVEGFPPVRVNSSSLRPQTLYVDGSISSMFVSALLMVAPAVGGVTVMVNGEQVSKPYISMTIDIMRKFGVTVYNEGFHEYRVPEGQVYSRKQYAVEGDVSSACYFFAVAALSGMDITVYGLNPDSAQGDLQFLDILESMGNTVIRHHKSIQVRGRGVQPVNVNMENCPDQAQTLAVLSAFADGTTHITGTQSLRVKETERIVALQRELRKMGIHTRATRDSLTVEGGKPQAAIIDTYNDHRMAMSFAVAGTKLSVIGIRNPLVVSKTFPNFWDVLSHIGVSVKTNIALIGMRGSGKTTVGRLLAERYQRTFVDLDDLIQQRESRSVADIVGRHGWPYFRNIETKLVEEVTQKHDQIIATGGGVVTVSRNVDNLQSSCIVVLLHTTVNDSMVRIANDPDRPPLTDEANLKTEMTDLEQKRKAAYQAAADIVIEAHGQSPDEIVDRIINELT